ncbi:unnamed protein product [Agarophyton chilense]
MTSADGGPTSSQKPESPPASMTENGASEPGSNGTSEAGTEIVLDENIAGFCSISPRTGRRLELSLREKEALFLDAVQAYFRGEPIVNNAEFDALKEELTWQGSAVISLDRDEFRFLEAAKDYERGKPSMADDEFDALKVKLIRQGSVVSIQRGPRCSVRRQITFSDVIIDKRRTFVLYVPAGILIALLWLSFSFEFTPLHNVDPVISLILGSPVVVLVAKLLTGLVVPEAQIMVGDCPSCGRRTHVLFGNVFNIAGFSDTADVKCDKCKAALKVERSTNRMILLSEGK